MKALVKKYAKEGLWLEDKPKPKAGINDVLIKVKKMAICGTDIHIYNWDEWAQSTIKPPVITGHEYCGVVEAIGSNIDGVKIGELVSGEGHIVCEACRNCLAGRRHLCKDTFGVGINRDGAFAEYVSIPLSNVWHCDPTISEDVISCFDPFGNAVHTACSFDLLGEDVLITGAGPTGLMAAAVAKHAGARKVVITDVNEYRLDIAKKLGVTRAVNVKDTSIRDVMEDLNMKEGFDVGLEMSGNAHAFNQMIDSMIHGGKIAILGILPNNSGINWPKMIFNGITLKGIYGREMYETWYKMTSMVQSGLDISPVITHKYKFDNFHEAFELMKSGNSGKVILEW